MKVTPASANGYAYLSSDDYPPLLDLKDKTISIYVSAYPVTTDSDAELEIYTVQADGTEQTLTSTTTNVSGARAILKLEDQTLNDNLEEVQIRLRCVTNGNVVYFGAPRIVVSGIYDYMLPELFQEGGVAWVRRQISGSDWEKPADDTGAISRFIDYFNWELVNKDINGTVYKYLRTPNLLPSNQLLELSGTASLEDNLSSDSDTMTIDDPHTQLFVLQASKQLFKMQRTVVSAESSDIFEKEIARIDFEIQRLGNLRMMRPTVMVRTKA